MMKSNKWAKKIMRDLDLGGPGGLSTMFIGSTNSTYSKIGANAISMSLTLVSGAGANPEKQTRHFIKMLCSVFGFHLHAWGENSFWVRVAIVSAFLSIPSRGH